MQRYAAVKCILQFGYFPVPSTPNGYMSSANPQRHINAVSVPCLMCNRKAQQIRPLHIFPRDHSLLLPRLLRIAAHNLDLLRRHIVLVVELEVDILDEERPDFVAEAVGIQMTLCTSPISPRILYATAAGAATLKFMRALTLSANTSVMDLSKVAMTFMAV